MKRYSRIIKTDEIVLLAILAAILVISKKIIEFVPNVELVSFLIIIYTLHFKWSVLFPIYTFILVDTCTVSFNLLWLIPYLYTWALLAFIVIILGCPRNKLLLSVISGIFGLVFDLFFAVIHLYLYGYYAAAVYLIGGIPYSLVHGIANFLIMFFLFTPINNIFQSQIKKNNQ